MIQFDLPKERSSIIKVIGVGGGGGNAVNHMFSQNIEGVNFIICNTDAQALAQSPVPNKIQLGPHLTQGLGAGANPDIGRQATEESLEEIKSILEVNTKMAFITAGMGGGTGTGGAPILSKICKDLGILTVGIVTTPFSYEGRKRQLQAEEGIQLLKDYVDTLLVISNDKLRHQFGNLKMKEAFSKADNVLATAAKCITDVINTTGQINVDFADVCTVMRNGGVAILGSSAAAGNNRAQQAIEEALNSPLLNDNEIRGAKWILININSAEGDHEFTMDEVEIIQQHLLSQAGEDTDVILGLGYDRALGDKIGITIIATGFEYKDPFTRKENKTAPAREEKIVMPLEMPANMAPVKKMAVVTAEETPEPEKTLAPRMAAVQTGRGPVVMFPQRERVPEPAVPMVEKNKPDGKIEWILSQGSGGYLEKPSNIYAEESIEKESFEPPVKDPVLNAQVPISREEISPADMQLVFRDPIPAADMPGAHQTQPILMAGQAAEEPAVQDEAEELKRRAADRISKLRNLSFNINAVDPNNEFETVPAYIRRNLELYNTVNNVENFYSNYEVKSDNLNNAEISTINTFLHGKKPD
jgi:cell division protein FtsZ